MKKFILIFIIVLAAFLRLYKLDSFPALNADEAALGYNAYSLLETGKDEHGNPWPIHFQSFNDYKPGLYFYVVLPFVKYLGLNEWAVRLPGALFGIGTVLVVYLLVGELGKFEFSRFGKRIDTDVWPLVSALFLAISPWHLHFSRGGWEVNAATFFVTTGVWLFLKARKKPILYFVGFLFFVFSLYTYHATRVVVPLLVLGLVVFYRSVLLKNIKWFAIAIIIGGLLLIPLLYDLTSGGVLSRASGVGIFADTGTVYRINEQRGEHLSARSFSAVIYHNKIVNYSLVFLENWGEHFWGEFLFLSGDEIQRNRVPETGQMYIYDLLLVIVGGIGVIRAIVKKKNRGLLVVVWWLLVAPVAAALTFQSPHALRAHNMVIPLTILSAYGLVYLSYWLHNVINNKRLLDVIFVIFVFFVAWSFSGYLHNYWIHMVKEYPFSSQYGVNELVQYIEPIEDDYEKIVVTDRYDQPYILFLFYLKYPPSEFQTNHRLTQRDKFGFSTVRNFGRYKFEDIDFEEVSYTYTDSLIIGTDEQIPNEHVIKEIFGINGYKYFEVVVN